MRRFFALAAVALVAAAVFTVSVAAQKTEQKKEGQAKESKKEQSREGKEQGQRLTLNIAGVECGNCARVLTSTLNGCGIKLAVKLEPNPDGPVQVAATCEGECDLGACAAKVNAAKTPHRDKTPPGMSLVLFSKLDDKTAEEALTACRKIKGVDGAACKVDAKTGEIDIKIAGGQKITPPQIVQALREAGIQAQPTKSRETASNK